MPRIFILIAALLCLSLESQALNVNQHISKIDSTINWIWSGGRTTTGNTSYFYGHRLTFYNANNTNGADRSFGYFLYYTYDMYCNLRGRSNKCLGSRLKVYFRISSTGPNNKTMTVSVNGQSRSSNYFQGIRAAFFKLLEQQFGSAGLTGYERGRIYPAPQRIVSTELRIMSRNDGSGNNIWKGSFGQNVLNQLNSRISNILKFRVHRKSVVRNSTLYNYSQGSLVRYYKNRGTSGKVTAVISGPGAQDSFGRAYVQRASRPIFIMNHCQNFNAYRNRFAAWSTQNYNCTGVGIFLHELGHQMNLGHCQGRSGEICTDNLATTQRGKNYLLSHMLNRTSAVRLIYGY